MKKFFVSILVIFTLVFSASNTFAARTPGGGGIGGSTGGSGIGSIDPGGGVVVPESNDPSSFIAGLVRASLSLLLIVAFVLAVVWTIIAGIKFVLGGSDPKAVSAAWSQIYWGLIGLVIVVGSFAIIKMVETFFHIEIISGGFQLPDRTIQ